MRTRTKVLIGASFGVGYYLGAKAGERRYRQLRRVVDKVPVGATARKARALVALGVERVRSPKEAEVIPLRPAASGE